MEANPVLFRDLTYIFVAAVLGGLIAWRLRLPVILGFVLGGIVISPLTPGPHLSDVHTFEVFAEVGVVLLMFPIGVEFRDDFVALFFVALSTLIDRDKILQSCDELLTKSDFLSRPME